MANNKMNEGVGKKIVEALKMQSDIEINSFENEPANSEIETSSVEDSDVSLEELAPETNEEPLEVEPEITEDTTAPVNEDLNLEQEDMSAFEKFAALEDTRIPKPQTFIQPDLDDYDMPSNVAVLKQLITKLPAGVTKQTGALIIKQTMEALGISMRSVLQEAQQVQENLNNSAKECQASIVEYKKQIGALEKQTQKYQRQSAALNDVISVFLQTSI